ncbi:hypothetical protein V5E97_02455 [Singulisphaera sp. Ch08]|uniref:Uncharacterized protein n=1 Tax=Singulisphaera sp. Ch08 TaxID=3120278 RepID=A0AAU7CHG5_9BACT
MTSTQELFETNRVDDLPTILDRGTAESAFSWSKPIAAVGESSVCSKPQIAGNERVRLTHLGAIRATKTDQS